MYSNSTFFPLIHHKICLQGSMIWQGVYLTNVDHTTCSLFPFPSQAFIELTSGFCLQWARVRPCCCNSYDLVYITTLVAADWSKTKFKRRHDKSILLRFALFVLLLALKVQLISESVDESVLLSKRTVTQDW